MAYARYRRPRYNLRYRSSFRRTSGYRKSQSARTFVPFRAFQRPKRAYSRGVGKTLKGRCSRLVKRVINYRLVADPTDSSVFTKVPKSGYTLVQAIVGGKSRTRIVRNSYIRSIVSFLQRRDAGTDFRILSGNPAQTAAVMAQVQALLTNDAVMAVA